MSSLRFTIPLASRLPSQPLSRPHLYRPLIACRRQYQYRSAMPSYPPYRYMSGDELAALIKSDKRPNSDYIIVDVRDEDFVGGNIKYAINSPSESFEGQVKHLVEKTQQIPTVVFHCALSQQRGPKAARIYAEMRDALKDKGQSPAHEVFVLRGGFTEFQIKYRNDPELVENWDKNVWNNPYY